ncbi:WbqC family protein [Hymenobacter canadensis]|uniref:WbqC family protein n=1 Tax=Hymenobacter canadensis TaxID=2999067 RepID=A0ABY7LRY7_9BACT|nr:WbqC family protein [Hymenobacter canadensis]WBA41980.1 WbqC family protein [Hymenobacter canadensis]
MIKRVAILQSNYIPWKGYFDLLNSVDDFIFYDEVQYTKNDWRNRNRIKTAQGVQWLTMPVRQERLAQTISETEVSDPAWRARHWRTLAQAYARSPHFEQYRPELEKLYAVDETRLSVINQRFIRAIQGWLGSETRLHSAADFTVDGDRTARLVQLVQAVGGTEYVSGPAASAYLDADQFARAGIDLTWMSYEGYPEYPQLHGPFEHRVSVLDLLLNTGPEAARYMLSFPNHTAL